MNLPSASEAELLGSAIFSAQALAQSKQEADLTGRRYLEILEEHSGLPAAEFVLMLGNTFHYPTVSMAGLRDAAAAFDLLSYNEAVSRECLALRASDGSIHAVFADPYATDIQDWMEEKIKLPISWFLAHRADLIACLAAHEETLKAMDDLLPDARQTIPPARGVEDLSLKTIHEGSSAVVRLVSSTLYDALMANASDIHLEMNASELSIKYRIDGVLVPVGSVPGKDNAEQIISRVKVMSELDIAESRIPQDGRFKVSVRGREVDLRVSIMPSIFGEDAVLRILDKQALADQSRKLQLDHLGFDRAAIALLRRLSNEPYGMLLVTGPTGSGKTTTLYAAISEINHGRDKIITIEDPVEYQLSGVLQIPVNEKKGLTFARGLRSILRHDPDKIMVGEIRDSETAQIAVQSALTGHLVFTTVHANNVFDVIGRFIHMGVDTYSFVSALNGILAQRLVRLNCPRCTAPYQPGTKLLADSALDSQLAQGFDFRAGRGCGECRGTGYRGRKAIAEILHLNDEIREKIVSREPIRDVKEAACRHGTRPLREAALALVAAGETNLEEINRVTLVG